MGGGLIQLIAYGAQDVYLTGNPQITFWKVVYRRCRRILKEGGDLPHLIVVDGGKGQLSSAVKSLTKLNLQAKISVVGIAKRLEELYTPHSTIPIYLDKRSKSLRLIQQLRDEAHRFGIKHHRNKRSNVALKTSLEQIKGVGPKTISLLITYFGSVKKVNEAKKEELIKLIGNSRAKKILNG